MAHVSLSQFKTTLAGKLTGKHSPEKKTHHKQKGLTRPEMIREHHLPRLTHAELEALKLEVQRKIRFERRKELILIVAILAGCIYLGFLSF